jgi:dihydrodipicolinate synthase/N-acetylneuraminate lyase
MRCALPKGIVPLLETPFDENGKLDCDGLLNLVEDTIASGVNGLTAPLVASEVHALSDDERERVITIAARAIGGRVPFIAGASSDHPEVCRRFARLAEQVAAAAYVVAVPAALYNEPAAGIVGFFRSATAGSAAPLIIQDLQFNGPGMDMDTIRALRDALPILAGLKIETVPAGPKYTQVRAAFGPDFYISGGWAVPQLIEALDRGVDAMIPESALVRVFAAIYRAYAAGNRDEAVRIFRELAPVLAFSNQELFHSIAFFKRLLARKGILHTARMRPPGYEWDPYRSRIADEIIDYYLELEARYPPPPCKSAGAQSPRRES